MIHNTYIYFLNILPFTFHAVYNYNFIYVYKTINNEYRQICKSLKNISLKSEVKNIKHNDIFKNIYIFSLI